MGDYGTPEQEIPGNGPGDIDWESCMTMNDHWGYNKHDHHWKSSAEMIRMLVDVASKGGNYLLNVGPDAEGCFPEPAVERLRAIGRWLRVNGEAIYGTRAVAPYKVGRVCLTRKGSMVYLIYLADNDESGPPAELRVPEVVGGQSVSMLGSAMKLSHTFTRQGRPYSDGARGPPRTPALRARVGVCRGRRKNGG